MPSVLSHPAVALAASRFPVFRASRALVLAGAVLTALPDVDSIGFWLGVPYASPLGHRGLTHSIAFAALAAAIALLVVKGGTRGRAVAFAYLFLCAVSHGLLDGMTDGGLGIAYFAPFSNTRYFLPWRPIPVSPISIIGFFDARGLHVLAAEAIWIWVPAMLAGAAAFAIRRPLQGPPSTGA